MLLTLHEAAERLTVSVTTVRRLTAATVFIGIPLAMFGTLVLIEFRPGRED